MADKEQELTKKFQEYQSLAKSNPNINVGMLMMSALSGEKQNRVEIKAKRLAYFVSIALPPFGFFFALKYLFDDKDDSKQVAWTCIILTVLAVLSFWVFGKLFFSGSGANVQQIQQIKPADLQSLY